MIIRNATAILAAIFLVTIQAEAKPSNITEFCDTRYCGHVVQAAPQQRYHRKHVHYKKPAHKEKRIQLASLGVDEVGFTGEAPAKSKSLLAMAESYLGTNPTGWRSLWCARFIGYLAPAVANRLKRMGLNPNWARDYAELPEAKRIGRVGDLVVLTRGLGGHIGFVKKFDKNGNPIVVSGNHGHKVGIGTYSKHRVLAYVSL